MSNPNDSYSDPWAPLRQLTMARIALGRAGGSVRTDELLRFNLAHALAVDAVYADFKIAELAEAIQGIGLATVSLQSAAADRAIYLQRPDLGRRLDDASQARLVELAQDGASSDVALIVSDGLSANAAHRQVVPLLAALVPMLTGAGHTLAPIVLVRHARVAIEDEIGRMLRAKVACILLGERPGLGTPDSLGAYLVYGPQSGNNDAQRNCVSNIRPDGLPHQAAAETLAYLITESLRRAISGISLKDERRLSLDADVRNVLEED